MAKVYYSVLCILLLCNCHNNGVQDAGISDPVATVETPAPPAAVEDIPVLVDTAVAMPDSLPAVVVVTTVETDTVSIVHQPSLTEIYLAYIGVREATGKNDGPVVRKFLRSVGLPEGFAWCAGFVKTCLMEAGIPGVEKINGMALSCENKKNMVWAKGAKIKDPEPGDVFTLYYPSLKRIGHTGFHHHRINSSIYESVEGNTNAAGSREGDGVYKKKRSYNATHSISRWR